MTAARSSAGASGAAPDSGPPKSQSIARPPTGGAHAPSGRMNVGGPTSQLAPHPPPDRGSSGPQPLTPPPQSMQPSPHGLGLGDSGGRGMGLGISSSAPPQ